jgi:hypothetical protein
MVPCHTQGVVVLRQQALFLLQQFGDIGLGLLVGYSVVLHHILVVEKVIVNNRG